MYIRILILAVLMAAAPAFSLAAADHVVAKVGDVPITSFEVQRRATRIMPFNVSYHGTVTEEKKKEIYDIALSDLLTRAYKISYALSQNMEVPESQIDEKIEKVKERLKTQEAFDAATSSETVDGLRASIRRDFLSEMAEDFAVDSKVLVTEDQVKSYYEEYKHTFAMPKQFRASHILIKVDPAATEDVREEFRMEAEGILRKARAGENFYNLAYYNSDDKTSFVGGDIGMFHEGQVPKAIEKALLKINVGEITDIVETMHGYNILKLTQVEEPRQLAYDEVRTGIRSKLEKKRRETLYDEWINNLQIMYEVERFTPAP